MMLAAVMGTMHCPKCGNNYPEGSQRFCDIDGDRLVSEHDVEYRTGGHGADTMSGQFFETKADAIEFAAEAVPVFDVSGEEPPAERIFGRRVNPYDIPSGHVDAGEHGNRSADEFDADDPIAFVGRTVKGRYRVTELLGEDDMGFAFLGDDQIIDDRRVLIRILTHEQLDEITEAIFDEERVSLLHLNHPKVVRLIDSGEFVDGTKFLISEHLDCLTLRDVLQIHGRLSVRRTARIIRQAANALSDVHQEGVLHRDLRPEFMVLTSGEDNGEMVKLSNFGVSGGEPNADNLLYKAPEILDGRIPTIAGDIYTFGVIAFQTLTGRMPFDVDSENKLAKAQKSGLKPLPTELRSDISHGVDEVFEKVLAHDPLERYATAREFGDALFAALSQVPTPRAAGDEVSLLPEVIVDEENVLAKDAAAAEGGTTPASGNTASTYVHRSLRVPETPPETDHSYRLKIAAICLLILLAVAAGVWYLL